MSAVLPLVTLAGAALPLHGVPAYQAVGVPLQEAGSREPALEPRQVAPTSWREEEGPALASSGALPRGLAVPAEARLAMPMGNKFQARQGPGGLGWSQSREPSRSLDHGPDA